MGLSCCDPEEGEEQSQLGIREDRKCRDVLFLILFFLFWIGMFIVAGLAGQQGDVNRLVYGLDSYGHLCGTVNKINGETIDLRRRKKLYYLNSLELVDIRNIRYAKSICVDKCPKSSQACSPTKLPCTNNTQYRCPYYKYAEDQLYDTLVELQQHGKARDYNTTYFSALKTTTQTQCNRTFPVTANIKFAPTFLTADTCGEYHQMTSQYNYGPCYPVWFGTVDYFHRCFPDASLDNVALDVVEFTVNAVDQVAKVAGVTDKLKSGFEQMTHHVMNYLADLARGWAIWLVSGLVGGLVLSVVWMVLVRFFGGIMTWLTVVALNLVAVLFTLFCFAKGNIIPGGAFVGAAIQEAITPNLDPAALDRRVWIAIGALSALITVLLLVTTLCMIRQLQVAVACLKVAVTAVAHMPSLFLFPLLPFILTCALVVYWVAISLLIWSAGEIQPQWRPASPAEAYSVQQLFNSISGAPLPLPAAAPPPPPLPRNATTCSTDPNCFYTYKWNSTLRWCFIGHLFGLLWTYQFLYGFTYVTIAGAVAYFYWNRTDNSMPRLPVIKSLWNATRYHPGSIALGAAILALLELVRLLLMALQRALKRRGAGCCSCGAAAAQWCLCCAQCCLSCVQAIVDFINRNAYIMIAIKGKGYCRSASTALSLIAANPGRQLAVEVVMHFLLWFGKLVIAGCCGIFAFLFTGLEQYSDKAGRPNTYITDPIIIVIVAVAIGYVVADIFFAVYEVAVQTVFLSFCEDLANHGGVPRYAPPVLVEAIGEYSHKAYGDSGGYSPPPGQFITSDGTAPAGAPLQPPPLQGGYDGYTPNPVPIIQVPGGTGYSAYPGPQAVKPGGYTPVATGPVSPLPGSVNPAGWPPAGYPPAAVNVGGVPTLQPYPSAGPPPAGYPSIRREVGPESSATANVGGGGGVANPPRQQGAATREAEAEAPGRYPNLTPWGA